MKIDPIVKKILAELKFNEKDCLWEKHGATCMKHRYIEIAGKHKGVSIDNLEEVEKNSDMGVVAVKCTASLGKSKVITYGEASPKNNKNSYPYAMAEKRAIDRAILKLIGVHGFIYSEDEVDSSMDSLLYKATAKDAKKDKKEISLENRMGDIEAHFDTEKPDLTTIKNLIVKLKSDKKNDYDNFIKSEIGKRLIVCDNKLRKLKTNRR